MNPRTQKAFADKVTQFVWLVFSVLESVLSLRFLLKLLGANPNSPISHFIFEITRPFLVPFHSLLGQPRVGDMVFEATTLVAVLIYALAGWVIIRAAVIILYPMTSRSSRPSRRAKTDVSHSLRSNEPQHENQ